MGYKESLSKIIKDSGLTLRDVESRCKAQGVSVSNSYLSQIKSGKLPPPTEEVTRAICQACNVDPENMIIEGYLEKAPPIVRDYFIQSVQINKDLLTVCLPYLYEQHNESYVEDLKDQIQYSDMILTLPYAVSYLEKLKRKTGLKTKYDNASLYDGSETSNMLETLDKTEHFISDDSMEPLIPKNSKLAVASYKQYQGKKKSLLEVPPEDKDIIYFIDLENGTEKVRRLYLRDNTIMLVPENKNYDIKTLKSLEGIHIYGKVVSYTASIL